MVIPRVAIIEVVYELLICAITLLVGWIAKKYNQPLMTRTDLRTGQNVSLLLFIRSKYDMRRIFDPDSDLEESNESSAEAMVEPEADWDDSEMHLRQQILFQMFVVDDEAADHF